MLWRSLFPCHISQPKIRYTLLNWGLCLLLGPLVEISFWSSILMLWRWICFIFGSAFRKVEAAYFFPSADLTISWQHHHRQPILLQFGDALLIYRNHRFLQLSQAPAARTSCTLRVRTWHHTPAPRRPRAVSADANGGLLWAPHGISMPCCSSTEVRQDTPATFSAPFGESLSVSPIATIPPPLLRYHDADGRGTQTPLCNPCLATTKTASLWKPG